MRTTVYVCAAGTIGLSIWLMSALVPSGPAVLPSVSRPADIGTSGQPTRLGEATRRHGPVGQFALGGRVVDASTGAPLASAAVDVWSDDNNGVFGSTVTDQRGDWTLTQLPAGGYYVTARKAEYQTRHLGLPAIALADARPQRIVNLELARGSVLSGRISHSSGRPAAGISVNALRVVSGAGGTTLQFEGDSAQVDDSGWFRLSGLREGEYVLAARSWGRFGGGQSRRTEVSTFYPGTADSSKAERFTLAAGTTRTGLTFAMQSLPSVTVRGHVISSTGHRVHAAMTVEDRNKNPLSSGSTSFWRQSPSSEFSIANLTRGRYRLLAKTEELNGVRETGSMDVTVEDSDIAGLVLRTGPPTTLRGRVVADGYESWNLDWMMVGAMPADSNEASDTEPARVRRDRTFEIKTRFVPARIVVFQPLGGWEVKSVRWKGQDATDGLLSFHAGETVSDVEVILRRRASVLEGTVHDPADCTFVIVLQRAEPGKAACVASSPVRDGQFRTLPLPAGDYRVVATNGPFPVSPEALWTIATPVTLTDNQTLAMALNGHRHP